MPTSNPRTRKAKLFIYLVLGLWWVVINSLWAATIPFKSYSTSDGLAHDLVNRIIRDSRGFLWFCTSEGLSRFDGYEFKNYTQEDGLPHRAINDFLETRDGKYWIATNDGLVQFDPVGTSNRALTGESSTDMPMFRTFRPANSRTEPSTWAVFDLLEDHDSQVWIASISGLYRLEGNGDETELELLHVYDPLNDQKEGITDLLEDHTGAIWAGNGRGLYRISSDRARTQIIDQNLRVQSFLEDKTGHVWVGSGGGDSEGRGLFLYSLPGDEPHLDRIFYKKDGLLSDNWMNALLQTSDGRIFVGNGLCEYTPQADNDLPQFRILSAEGVSSLGEDASGNLWFGTESGGVKRMTRNGFVNFGESDGLKFKNTTSIVSDTDGEVYTLSSEKTISRFNGKGFDTITPLNMIQPNWGNGQVTFRDSHGEWWIEGIDGLQRYPKTDHFEDLAHTRPLKTYAAKDGLFANGIFRLFEDSRGDIWISVIGNIENTLVRWERLTETFHRYTTEDNLPLRNGPTAFGEDRAGNVWIGYYGGGLIRFHHGSFEPYSKDEGLPPDFIKSIFTDSVGRVWVATSADGVIRIDDPTSEEKPILRSMTRRDGLSSNQALCVTEDDFGRIYIGTGRGVDRLDVATGRVKVFTKADGLPENIVKECKRDPSGALWFGTPNGLARYVPVSDEQTAPPPIFLSALRVNGESIKKLSELGETDVKDLDLASDQRQVQIDFFALGFGTGETLRYQYKLDGIDPDWSQPVGERTVNLNLSAGKYRFMVRAINADGITSADPAIISFSIARPIWQQGWFLVLLTLVIAALMYMVYRYRLKRLLELEKVRIRIATDLHDDIGSSLSKIAILSEVVHQRIVPVAADSADINQPLEEITETSRDLVESMSDIVWAINPERDQLSDLVHRMRNLAGEMTEWAEIGMKFSSNDVETDGTIPLGADLRREIYLIFKETINNLVKHSGCESVEIEICRKSDNLLVSVRDNGRGFDVAATAANSNGSRAGNGLKNMRRRAANLKGRYEITSDIGKGTLVVLTIPFHSGWASFSLKEYFSR